MCEDNNTPERVFCFAQKLSLVYNKYIMKTFSRVFSAQPYQLSGHIVSVEIDITNGLHAFTIVGLPDKSIDESRDRVASAIKNSGYISPKQENHKTVVSLAPAELRKEGAYYDLAIAVGYLLSNHELDFDPSGKIFVGELSLNGELKNIHGVLPIVRAARDAGFSEIFVPFGNADEASLITGITVYPAKTLREVIDHLSQQSILDGYVPRTITPERIDALVDFRDIRGQESAKRGLEIAAAGGHNIIMSGPPGTGKTMLARAFTGILPQLAEPEMLEVTGIHSIAGTLRSSVIMWPPFRSPHHTASHISIIGGGSTPKPGEVTLAHHGVLFMDEFPEFDTRVIEALRQPIEDKVVNISRVKGSASFPARFTLVAAMNPCPCGNKGALHKQCVCSPGELARYRKKLSGPIMDRIDIHLTVEHIDYDKLSSDDPSAEYSTDIAKRVAVARDIQAKRFNSTYKLNSHMSAADIASETISPEASQILNESATKLKLSPRSYHRTIKLARTIADLDGAEHIGTDHILEALQYRPRE